ncbi:hypothetical protein MNEG_4648 [Monoraphidium neglectum]|uniref:Uncharacterized protein n=1 Tax=Monoraphidium neglectum TaxID=145388 RepID=A0A0D2NDB4_9CHLO|nr:hypothetical protein MNEG_4648 [Monoraphidium neglectum]KIZ03311.1 hypothetical protein MNEG_4648 [Monoraphidium neglectum]|eukprot:XP_013902330.1 hypothetical protein MNEG_4648 [Monoraphidium neglectum]
MGDIPWDFAGVIMGIAFVSTLFGQVAIDALIRRTGRGSVVVIVLAAFFTCACLLACYVAARSVVAFATSADHSIRAPGVC